MHLSKPFAILCVIPVLCQGARTSQQSHRSLNQAFTRFTDEMDTYYGGNCRINYLDNETTVYECSMPGSDATLMATGPHTTPETLQKCALYTGGGKQCQTWNFRSSQTNDEIYAEAFPSTPTQAPSAPSPRSQVDYYQVLWAILAYYSGDCTITLNNQGNTEAACSMMGGSATFTAEGIQDQTPMQIKKCTMGTGGNQSCQTYNFNGSMDPTTILDEAFPNQSYPSSDYYTVLQDMIPYYHGACSMTLSHGNTDVACSMPGSNVKFTAQGTNGQTPMQLMKCTTYTGGNNSCQTFNFNGSITLSEILDQAF